MSTFRTTAVHAAIVLVLWAMVVSGGAQAAPATKEVEVINDASSPVPVVDTGNPAFRPFQAFAFFTNAFGSSVTVTTVPDGNRLVIEFLTVSCQSTAGIEPTVVQIFGGILHSFSIQNTPFGPGYSSVATHTTRMYVNPGSNVVATVFPTTVSATINCDIALTGHLVAL